MQPVTVEFYDDGRVIFGNETGTYTQNGSRLIMGVGSPDTDGFDFLLGDGELTLLTRNLAAGLSKEDARAKAILLANQMDLYDQFPNLNETDDVYRIQFGMIFDYKGLLPSVESAPRGPAKGDIPE